MLYAESSQRQRCCRIDTTMNLIATQKGASAPLQNFLRPGANLQHRGKSATISRSAYYCWTLGHNYNISWKKIDTITDSETCFKIEERCTGETLCVVELKV